MIEFDYSDENIKRTIEKDFFDRNIYLDSLVRYVNDSEEQTTFALNGEWGSGKTVFVHQFMYEIKHQEILDNHKLNNISSNDYEVYYYNAWENELMRKPSIAILNSIIEEYKVFSQEDKQRMKEVLDVLGNIALKLGTCGILGMEDIKLEKDDEINISKIRQTFSKVIDSILKKKECKRVIIIIDELDRCKPTNVVHMLEEIKHFYDHSALTFIFSADLNQLGHTINNLYGENFDSGLYLQRFFDATFTLNSSSYERYINEELGYYISESNIVTELCKVAIGYCNLTVRETNKFVKKMRVIAKDFSSSKWFEREIPIAQMVFVPWGLALKYKDLAKYERFMSGKIDKKELESFLKHSKEVPDWLAKCYLQNNAAPEGFDIVDTIFSIYQTTFSSRGFRYYKDDYNSHTYRQQVAPYIEF